MYDTDQRVALVQLRLKEIRQKKRLHQVRTIRVLSVIVCLLIVVGISSAMPGILAGMGDASYGDGGAVAGIFADNGKIGYIFVSALAFVLGVCVTLLSFHLRHKEKVDI